MPVQWVNRASPDFRGFSGRIASGTVQRGDVVRVAPADRTARVARIVTYDADVPRAVSGQSVTIVLDRDLDISRGDVIASDVTPPTATRTFAGRLLWTADEAFERSRPLLLKAGSSTVPIQLGDSFEVLDIGSGECRRSSGLQVNDIARVLIASDVPMVLERYAESRELGGFILIDRLSGDTVALGMVDAIEPDPAGTKQRAAWRSWLDASWERPWRSFAKAVTWRATGSVDTFLLSYVITGNPVFAGSIAVTEIATKIVLYYLHERVWSLVGWGKKG